MPEGREVARERAAAGAGPDDDHVVGVHGPPQRWGSAHLHRWLEQLGDDDPRGGLDQREVRERLREVAEVAAGVGVELLGVEPERRRDPQQPLHQVARLLQLADDRERGDEPERADEERALLAREAVVGLVGAVAEHEAVLGQLLGDRVDRRAQPLVVGGEEAEDRGEQHRGVERVGLVVLAQDAAVADAVLEDVGADLLGGRAPLCRLLAGRRGSRPACAARSSATQHMSFDET